ncbi:MAG: hypothetical protein HPY66_2621 [Firmicutes bacterium]|nr:hypothetical protein [Bacillota bacterium]MDI6704991.1 DUF4446 family protein [Bacillota bacterium]
MQNNWAIEIVKEYGDQIMIYLIIAVTVAFVLLLLLAVSAARINGRFKRLMRGAKSDNIEGMIIEYTGKIEEIEEENKEMLRNMESMGKQLKGCFQKFGIVRYNAFQDTGSDLSFSLALLDYGNNGVVISSIYGRSESITYAKPIHGGKSSYALSKEEKEALDKAMK